MVEFRLERRSGLPHEFLGKFQLAIITRPFLFSSDKKIPVSVLAPASTSHFVHRCLAHGSMQHSRAPNVYTTFTCTVIMPHMYTIFIKPQIVICILTMLKQYLKIPVYQVIGTLCST